MIVLFDNLSLAFANANFVAEGLQIILGLPATRHNI